MALTYGELKLSTQPRASELAFSRDSTILKTVTKELNVGVSKSVENLIERDLKVMSKEQNQPHCALDKPLPSALITALIVLSVVFFSLETLPDLKDSTRKLLWYFEITIVGIFTAEYLYRIYTSENRVAFVFSFYGVVDLLAILPFYLATAIDLRSLRLLRLLRLARILKLARYNRAILRFSKAVSIVKEELVIFTLASLVLIFLAAVGIYHFEHNAQPDVFSSIFDSIWWAVASLTTVGYGDIYPITIGGRVFTFIILMIGLGLVAVPTGIIASALTEVRNESGF